MRKNNKKYRSIANTALAITGGFVGGLSARKSLDLPHKF